MADITALLAQEFGAWSQDQHAGFLRILAAAEASALPLAHRAYALATAYHETARAMIPVVERGAVAYFDKYEPGTHLGRILGNIKVGDGYRYRGRGDAQITGRANYRSVGQKIGYDLENNPSKALDPDIAAKILVLGTSHGWFTGKKLADFGADYLAMRKTVNGMDKAAVIAAYARKFETILRTMAVTNPPPVGQARPAPKVPPKRGLLAFLLSLFSRS